MSDLHRPACAARLYASAARSCDQYTSDPAPTSDLSQETIDGLRGEIERLTEWKNAILGTLQDKSEFRDAKWAGDKTGWGFPFEFINWLYRERRSLKDRIAGWEKAYAEQAKALAIALHVVGDMVDSDPCRLDHHGFCQAHGWMESSECVHARAKRLLGVAPSAYMESPAFTPSAQGGQGQGDVRPDEDQPTDEANRAL